MAINRREFIGGVIAVTSTSRFASGMAIAPPDPSGSPQGWLSRGMIDAGGNHEPYMFTVRRGGQRFDERQSSDYQQSEELIRQLHDEGVDVFHTHLYKGFGMEAEREEMEAARKAVEFAHRLGMKVDTYIQWNSLMYETFFAEEPKAVEWIPAIIPISALLQQSELSGLPQEGCAICNCRSEDRLYPLRQLCPQLRAGFLSLSRVRNRIQKAPQDKIQCRATAGQVRL
jgi:hypothetical protein